MQVTYTVDTVKSYSNKQEKKKQDKTSQRQKAKLRTARLRGSIHLTYPERVTPWRKEVQWWWPQPGDEGNSALLWVSVGEVVAITRQSLWIK